MNSWRDSDPCYSDIVALPPSELTAFLILVPNLDEPLVELLVYLLYTL